MIPIVKIPMSHSSRYLRRPALPHNRRRWRYGYQTFRHRRHCNVAMSALSALPKATSPSCTTPIHLNYQASTPTSLRPNDVSSASRTSNSSPNSRAINSATLSSSHNGPSGPSPVGPVTSRSSKRGSCVLVSRARWRGAGISPIARRIFSILP